MNAEHRHTSLDVRRNRAATVAAATIAPLIVWLVAEFLLAIDVRSPAFGPDQPSAAIGPVRVILTALIASGAGWLLLAVLERMSDRGRTVWAAVAGVVLLISLGGPLGGEGITTSSQAVLLAMHLAVGLVLIPRLYRSALHEPTDAAAEQLTAA